MECACAPDALLLLASMTRFIVRQAAITLSPGFFEGKRELQTIKMWLISSSDLQLVATFRAGISPIVGVSWRRSTSNGYQVARYVFDVHNTLGTDRVGISQSTSSQSIAVYTSGPHRVLLRVSYPSGSPACASYCVVIQAWTLKTTFVYTASTS